MVHRLGISSMSLGRAWVHDLPGKLDQAAKYGFEGIEIFFEDLEYYARTLPGGSTPENQIRAGHEIRKMCEDRKLSIINLQPFSQYDGLLDRSKHDERIEELKLWFKIAQALRTDLIQVPANFLPEDQLTGDIDVIVSDLQEIADLGAQYSPPFRFAYESLAWSTHINTWEQSWDIVERVDRPNFGICLDTYNIAGRIYADPTSADGKTPNAEAVTKASIERLSKRVDARKVFFIQIVDGERLHSPLVEGHPFYIAEQPARMSWSRNCRLFYGETELGAYLPVKELTNALIHGIGFQGWVSMELFNRSMADSSPDTPAEHARRGAAAWGKMIKEIGLDVQPKSQPAAQRVKNAEPQMLNFITSKKSPPMQGASFSGMTASVVAAS